MKESSIKITDTTLRDAQQSLLASRLRLDDLLPVAEKLDSVGFWSLEAWGGATFDSCLRFLREDPWERLRELRKVIKNTPMQTLIRGQNLLGYRHYADDVVERFIAKMIENGISIIRIFDPLNDIRNLQTAVKSTLKYGGKAELGFCYSLGPIYTNDFFVELAIRLEEMGAHTICIKDEAGILSPLDAFDLVAKLKRKISVPIHLHTHDTMGMGIATLLKAIEAGVDIVDTAISSMAGGASQPATESLCNILKGTPRDPFFSFKLLGEIADYFKNIRRKYKAYESEYTFIDPNAFIYQLPGGMVAHLVNQLKEQNALNRIDEILNEIPKVRRDFGYPPLVTPISQIVGTQATLNVLGGRRYEFITIETKNYFKGLYGNPPVELDEDIRKKILENEVVFRARPADILSPEMGKARTELGNKAKSEEDVLSYALFPKIFINYLESKEKGFYPEEETKDVDVIAKNTPMTETLKTEFKPNLAPTEFLINVHGESYNVKISGIGHTVNGKKPYFIYVDDYLVEVMVEPLVEVLPSELGQIDTKATKQSTRPKALSINDITSTMPGRIAKILVKIGDLVRKGDPLLILEAMKMENEIVSPVDGRVEDIFVSIGDSVNPDEALMRIV